MGIMDRTCNTETMNMQRILARVAVVIGGLFWIAAAWGARYAYQGASFTEAASYAAVFIGVVVVVFVLGMFFEGLAGVGLLAGAALVAVWGLLAGWSTGVFATMFFFAMLPMIIAGVLYLLAARMQRTCAAV